MKKQSAKLVSIDEVKKIQSTVKDLHEALVIFSENESSSLAKNCAKHIKKLVVATSKTLADLKKTKSK